MIDEQVILTVERLRDDLAALKASLRSKYDQVDQVTSEPLRKQAAQLAETWMVTIGTNRDVMAAIVSDRAADLSLRFQRLLTYAEHKTRRFKYDADIHAALKNFTADVVIPLKQLRHTNTIPALTAQVPFVATAFVGHSFAAADKDVVDTVTQTLSLAGISAVSGKKPQADSISEKVKRLIEGQHIFVGVFTRRDKIAKRQEWTTSLWVVEEKAYAVGKQKRLILLKEHGVGSIGGLQGDYEFLDFSRDDLHSLVIRMLRLFELTIMGFAK